MILILLIRALVLFYRRIKQCQTLDALYKLSDRELQDMGVTRYDIVYNVKYENGN